MLSPKASELKSGIRKDIQDTNAELAPMGRAILADSRETLRNLSLATGAMATGALVLLGSDFPSIHELIAIGTVLLLIEVILIFGYLIHAQSIDSKNYLKNKKSQLLPSFEVLNLCEDLRAGKITEEFLFSEAKRIATAATELARNNREKLPSTNKAVDQWDKIFIGFLGGGIFFIVLGIAIPYFWPHF